METRAGERDSLGENATSARCLMALADHSERMAVRYSIGSSSIHSRETLRGIEGKRRKCRQPGISRLLYLRLRTADASYAVRPVSAGSGATGFRHTARNLVNHRSCVRS